MWSANSYEPFADLLLTQVTMHQINLQFVATCQQDGDMLTNRRSMSFYGVKFLDTFVLVY